MCHSYIESATSLSDIYTRTPSRSLYPARLRAHHISDHDAINSTATLFLPYKEAISLDYCQFTGLWVQ